LFYRFAGTVDELGIVSTIDGNRTQGWCADRFARFLILSNAWRPRHGNRELIDRTQGNVNLSEGMHRCSQPMPSRETRNTLDRP
jgi:hypothetical protein